MLASKESWIAYYLLFNLKQQQEIIIVRPGYFYERLLSFVISKQKNNVWTEHILVL